MSHEANDAITRQAVDTLLRVHDGGRDLCPADTDPDEWAASVLHDLARVAELLDGAVTQVSGQRNETVAQNAQALATTIAAHRNLCVGGSRS